MLEPFRNSKYPIRCLKHYQVQSEHTRIQNPFKHVTGSIFVKALNSLKSLTGYAKTLHLRLLKRL